MRRLAEEAELARIAEQEAREEAERQRKMQEAAAKQKAREEEIEKRVRCVSLLCCCTLVVRFRFPG